MQGLPCTNRGRVTGAGGGRGRPTAPIGPLSALDAGHVDTGPGPGPREDDTRSHHVLGSPQETRCSHGPPRLEHQAAQEEGDVEGPGRQDPGQPSSVRTPRFHLSFLCNERPGSQADEASARTNPDMEL